MIATVVDQEAPRSFPAIETKVDVVRSELTVIIPVFNEINTVEEVLRRVVNEATPKEIIIVDDGSTDGTVGWTRLSKSAA